MVDSITNKYIFYNSQLLQITAIFSIIRDHNEFKSDWKTIKSYAQVVAFQKYVFQLLYHILLTLDYLFLRCKIIVVELKHIES